MAILSGSDFRSKVDGEIIRNESSFNLGCYGIDIISLSDWDFFHIWKGKVKKQFKVELMNTDFKEEMILENVIMEFKLDSAVEVILRFKFIDKTWE